MNKDKDLEEAMDIHTVWHSFCDYMKKWYYNLSYGNKVVKGEFVKSKRKYKSIDISQITGYEAMCRVGKYATKHPEIKIISCDDSLHMGSSIALIPHESEKKFWGTTVIFIPQCKTPSNEIFLYPHHLKALLKELNEMQKRVEEKNNE